MAALVGVKYGELFAVEDDCGEMDVLDDVSEFERDDEDVEYMALFKLPLPVEDAEPTGIALFDA